MEHSPAKKKKKLWRDLGWFKSVCVCVCRMEGGASEKIKQEEGKQEI